MRCFSMHQCWLRIVFINKLSSQIVLFHDIPAGEIEAFFDEQDQPLLKRTEIGQYWGIKNMKDNFKGLNWYFVLRKMLQK